MIHIDRLNIRLPAHLRSSASDIARHIGEGLARLPMSASQHRQQLALPPIRIGAAASGKDVAAAIVASIHQHLSGPSNATGATP